MVDMIAHNIDGISFYMKDSYDFSFTRKYGEVFCVFDQNDSGNISFGLDSGKEKYFVKIAGAKTERSCAGEESAIEALKTAMQIYNDLAHPRLIQLVDHFPSDGLYVAVFKWSEGDCLFDYWNFEKYKNSSELSPRERFRKLPCDKKIKAFDAIFDFLTFAESKGYVAVDFYDGSIIYDFQQDAVTICDIDFFRKSPAINDMGESFWGTKRLKAPEEYILGAKIDRVTNVFALGALLMHFFGDYTDGEVQKVYAGNALFPCRHETWQLSETSYKVTLKAVCRRRAGRYGSLKAFYNEWRASVYAP
jgi:serine/threonine protein kinase